jgi:hypothetical protein
MSSRARKEAEIKISPVSGTFALQTAFFAVE